MMEYYANGKRDKSALCLLTWKNFEKIINDKIRVQKSRSSILPFKGG
jgi:hypothetical protein